MKKIKYNNKGVTLIELLIVLAILGIVLQLLYSIFYVGNKSFNISKDRGFAQQDARIIGEFINTELRYIFKLDDNPLEGEYYSLEIKIDEEDNDAYSLEKRMYEVEEDIEGILVRSVNGEGDIRIEYKEEGKITSTFNKSGYESVYNISLENKPKLELGVELSSDGDNKIIYYSFLSDMDKFEDEDEEEGIDEDKDIDEDIKEYIPKKIYNKGDKVVFNGNIYRSEKKNNNHKPSKESHWKKIT